MNWQGPRSPSPPTLTEGTATTADTQHDAEPAADVWEVRGRAVAPAVQPQPLSAGPLKRFKSVRKVMAEHGLKASWVDPGTKFGLNNFAVAYEPLANYYDVSIRSHSFSLQLP
ncbi:hypothetical protein NDU88_004312 [Pleurodeles waltl]|uniref:Uncharacterized protein n=1 Tax=Pleurodeles waltl TaxID=8319 RepID=A0AAV7QBJ7_PLEWA|nr:hypothetical protein NDU88_004312 [Pleurodeles waltl]